ncbi:aminotransferase class I/II-fold pyridoxal phosphate-dependent enzyme [Methanofollis fontis]|uniref:Aminotransferase n=1 Tax=Methanofollis fontis TaxID=2052832 RepID=A0A483CYZ8_9EURY|nr:aminotransferase class I/II-fold pyridoxal phosphate-dependent enzyme [Methanofollis fontis]TAJ45512.1 aromatic amino acid aminotransferase [Methanofollis fontis]
MRNIVSERARLIPPSGIRKYFDLCIGMQDVISLGVGEPDYATPWKICEAGIYSIEQGITSYTSNRGYAPLCEALSADLAHRYGLRYSPDAEIIITSGVSEAADIAIRAVVDPGDEVLVIDPGYVSYAPCVTLAGGVPVPLPCRADDRFKITAEGLAERVTERTKAVILNFPNNPTGGVMGRDDYREIADIIVDNDLVLISDEVYSELTYGGTHCSPGTMDDLRERTIVLNGFSKAYAMTGWRIGYLCAPKEICDAALKIHQYVMLCAPVMGQLAALAALREGEEDKDAMVREYRLRRNLFVEGLNRIGLTCHLPEGAFYAFPSVESTGLSDGEFAERLLVEQKVAVVPGSVFGEGGTGHLRCAYAVGREDLSVAIERMGAFIEGLDRR